MKSLALFALFLLAAGAALGQTTNMRFDIPFTFYAGGEVLPAGEYQVQYDPLMRRIALLSLDNPRGIFLSPGITDELIRNAPRFGQLVFHKYGPVHFLRAMKTPAYGQYSWPATKLEKTRAAERPVEVVSLMPVRFNP